MDGLMEKFKSFNLELMMAKFHFSTFQCLTVFKSMLGLSVKEFGLTLSLRVRVKVWMTFY